MRFLMQVVIIASLITFTGVLQTGAWNGIIAQGGDMINLAKWNEMATQVINSFSQSGNTWGTKMILGSNDSQPVAIETNGTERVTISSGGNIGIGAVNPQNKLELNTSVVNTSGLRLTQLTTTSPTSTGAQTIGVTALGDVIAVPNGFPTILTTTATQANTSNTVYQNMNVLQFPVVAGKVYKFKAFIVYNSAATTTGIRLRATAPNNYWYSMTITSTATTSQYRAFYNNGTTGLLSTASVATTGNVAEVDGILMPTTSGNFIIQFASETNGSAITIQPGSVLTYHTY